MLRAVLSISGGMDSTCLLAHLLARGYKVHCISFDYGQKHRLELDRLQQNIASLNDLLDKRSWSEFFQFHRPTHEVIDLRDAMSSLSSALTSPDREMPVGHYEDDNMKQTVVPNRNAIFASIAYARALSLSKDCGEPVTMALGVHSGDHAIYPDCRTEFFELIEAAFKAGNWGSDWVSLYLPYLDMDKLGILRDALASCEKLDLDFDELLRNTSTSYLPDDQGRAHGGTGSDVERILAFHDLGRKDPVEYAAGWDSALAAALALRDMAIRAGGAQ